MKITIEIEEDDLPHVHDVLFNVLDLNEPNLTNEEVIKYWEMLPEEIKIDAAKWGTSDTEVRENMYIWFENNIVKKPEPDIEVTVTEPTQVDDNSLENINTISSGVEFFYPAFKEIEDIILSKDEESFACFCHSQLSGGIGMQIRNVLNLWDDNSPIHKQFIKEHNITHPDDMSDFIIRVEYNMVKLAHNNK